MNGRLLAALVLALLALAATSQAACGSAAADPFVGSWWEPTSGLRVQVEAAGEGYRVRVGSDLSTSPATASGGELRIAHPERGVLVLKHLPDDRLQLAGDGTTSLLERVPQHQ